MCFGGRKMEPIFGFLLYFAAVAVVVVVASKRGLKGWVYALSCLAVAPAVAALVGQVGGSMAAGLAVFLVPVVALFIALSSNTDERKAVIYGESSEYKKCPFCAEAVRKEAAKCKHCGSALDTPVAASAHPVAQSAPDDHQATMAHYGIRFADGKYWFGSYAYDKLSDAVNYASKAPKPV